MSGLLTTSLRIYNGLARRIVPGHLHSQRAYHERLQDVLTPGLDWLDLGCGHQILPPWVGADEPGMVARCRRAVGIDLDLPSLQVNTVLRDRVLGPLEALPFSDASFDLVTANMVMEHVREPGVILREIRRVLRPGGYFLFHTPNRNAPKIRVAAHVPDGFKKKMIWWLERRREEDVFPTHYQINTAPSIRQLSRQESFRVVQLDELVGTAVTSVLGPLALPELLFLRMLRQERFRHLRSNLIALLEKPRS